MKKPLLFTFYILLCYVVMTIMSALYIKAFEVIYSQDGFWMWIFIILFILFGNFFIKVFIGVLARIITPLNPYPRLAYWVLYLYYILVNIICFLLIIEDVDFSQTKEFLFSGMLIIFSFYFNWLFFNIMINEQEIYDYEEEYLYKSYKK